MNGTESSVATPLQMDWMRHGLTLGLLGLGLFATLGMAGLVLQQLAGTSSEREVDVQVASPGAGGIGREPVILAWTAEESEGPLLEEPSASPGTPLVLVAGSLTAFELLRSDSSWLVLEPDGTLRTESEGALVGFLHGDGPLKLGDSLSGPGLMGLHLLHYESWVSQEALVPIVESDGAGGWVVSGQRRFGIEVMREDRRSGVNKPSKPKLHPRTGLPMVELASKRS
jgi:hypothetical protein